MYEEEIVKKRRMTPARIEEKKRGEMGEYN